jgi:hypothetical protein
MPNQRRRRIHCEVLTKDDVGIIHLHSTKGDHLVEVLYDSGTDLYRISPDHFDEDGMIEAFLGSTREEAIAWLTARDVTPEVDR